MCANTATISKRVVVEGGGVVGDGAIDARRCSTQHVDAPAEAIREHVALESQSLITHEGLCDSCIGRPGSIWFFHDGQWMKLGSVQLDANGPVAHF